MIYGSAGGAPALLSPHRAVDGTAGARRALAYGVVAFGAFYWTPVTVGGLSLRLFEALLLTWALLLLPTARISLNAAVIGMFSMGLSLSVSLLVHGFDLEGLLLGARIAIALLIVVLITSELGPARAPVQRAVRLWVFSGSAIVFVGVAAWVLAQIGWVRIDPLLFRHGLGFRAQSFVLDPNRFGNLAGSVFAASSVLVLVRLQDRRWWAVAASLGFLGLATSQSRAALASAIVATGVAAAWALVRSERIRRRRVALRVFTAVGLLALLVAYVLATTPSFGLLLRWTGAAVGAGDSLTGNVRFQFALLVLESVFHSVPSAVFGAGAFGDVQGDIGVAFSPHNTYLAVLAAQGLIGLVLYVGMFAALFIRGLRLVDARRFSEDEATTSLRLAMLAAFLTVVIQGLSTVLVTTGFSWVTIALFTATLVVPRNGPGDAGGEPHPATA